MIAGTKVVIFDSTSETEKSNFAQIAISLLLSFILLLAILLPLQSLKSKKRNVHFIETSYNEQESKDLEKICTDSIGQFVTPSIKVYDKIENKQDLKYISAIYQLKDNYFADQNTFLELVNASVINILNSSNYFRIPFCCIISC